MKYLVSGLLFLFSGCLMAQNLVLEISGIKTDLGHIQIMIYTCSENYNNDQPDTIKRFAKTDLKDGCLNIGIHLKPGTYGVILMDDVIDSEVMEFNILGLPKKGFGFAGYYHRGIRRPRFEDFAFEIKDRVVRKKIHVRYF